MFGYGKYLFCLLLLSLSLLPQAVLASKAIHIPILCYHNLNPVRPGSMNLTPKKFEYQLQWLQDNGFTIIPLKEAVAYLQGKRSSLPNKSIVITVDDGWKSVYTYMFPIIRKHHIPVTLFIYPQTISEGKNSLTWDEVKQLQATGLFDIQSHTYDHPNFKQAKRRLSAAAYEKYVAKQLTTSKNILEEKLGTSVTLLAWPFGIYNDYLEQQAAKAGYEMAFTIDYRAADRNDRAMAQPRFMIVESESMKTFMQIANNASDKQ